MGGQDDEGFYSHAGRGARRPRMRLDEVPRAIQPRRIKPKEKLKSIYEETPKRETWDISQAALKKMIRTLTLQTETFEEVRDELERRNISASGVLISNVRSEMRVIINVLIEEGLITKQQLGRYRLQHQR